MKTETILIADDSIDNRRLLSLYLRKQGYTLLEAVDGVEAIDICRQVQPDMVLLDIEMPRMDGYAVCETLKNDERTREIEVIFLTAKTRTKDKVRGLELGAVDYITKPFDRIEVLARVQTQLRLHHLTHSLREANQQLLTRQKALDEDLKAAAQIQKSLIPSKPPETEHFRFAWRFTPCEYIGGDIFNIHRLDEDNLALYVVDVSGHGVPSAMVTVSVSQTLLPDTGHILKRRLGVPPYYEITPPSEVLRLLDREYPLERFDKYFTIAYLILDGRTGLIQYSCAAHPMPVLLRATGELELLDRGGSIIGMDGLVPFEGGEVFLQPGDRLFLYTDGVTEMVNAAGELFGEERLYEELHRHRQYPVDDFCDRIIQSVMNYGGNLCPPDDITLIAIDYA